MKLTIYKGDEFTHSLYLTQPAATSQDQTHQMLFNLAEVPPSNQTTPYVITALSDVTVNFESQAGSPNVSIDTTGGGVTLGTLANGEIIITLDETESALLRSARDLSINVVLVNPSGFTQTFQRDFCLDVLERSNQ